MTNKSFNLEEKDVYKLFNQIRLEESEFNVMDEEVGKLQKLRIIKNLNKRIKGKNNLNVLKYGSAAAMISLVLLVGVGTASPAFVENIPILNSITQSISNKMGFHIDYIKYSQLVNKSVTNNGIKITINEVLADNSKLIIGYTIKSDKKIENLQSYSLSRFLKINGKSFASGGSAIGNYVDDYNFEESEEIHTTLPQDSDKFNVDLNITEIGNVKGKWDFGFSMSNTELSRSSTVFKPNKQLEFPSNTMNIEKVVFSPIDTAIFISGRYKDEAAVSNSLSELGLNSFLVYDDKGVELMTKGGQSTSDSNPLLFNAELDFNNLKSIPKYLTVIPYSYSEVSSSDKSKIIDGTFPIVLSQGNFGKIIINEINTKNNETIIKYTAEGKAPAFQASKIFIKDATGEKVGFETTIARENGEKPNEFTIGFKKLDPNKKYSIGTEDLSNYELREDLKFNIELNK